MATALDRIIDYKKDEVLELEKRISFSELDAKAKAAEPVRGFKTALKAVSENNQNALICEIKRKSPSAGDILAGAEPTSIASEYERGGAACLSILTDFPSFGGTLSDLEAVRKSVSLPLLRKDFMISPLQIIEARAHGADCILLIMSALDDVTVSELMATAADYDLDVLTEVHDEVEMERALRLNARLIGVNNRNLKEMTTDLSVSERITANFPGVPLVSESGIRTRDDILRLRKSKFSQFLIGESLMKETNRENYVQTLVNSVDD